MNAHNPLKQARVAVSVAQGLVDAANACAPNQQALKARLIVAASTIDILCELLLWALARRSPAQQIRPEQSEA